MVVRQRPVPEGGRLDVLHERLISLLLTCYYDSMTTARRCVSVTGELNGALIGLAFRRKESVSSLVETLLREHPLVREEIEGARLEAKLPDIIAVPGPNSPLRNVIKPAPRRASSKGGAAPTPPRKRAALTE